MWICVCVNETIPIQAISATLSLISVFANLITSLLSFPILNLWRIIDYVSQKCYDIIKHYPSQKYNLKKSLSSVLFDVEIFELQL